MFVLLEGVDRAGKTTIAKEYERKGFRYVHVGAPSPLYYEAGYTGSSYLEHMIQLYMEYDGQNTVFDRTPYGELIWPIVYNRPPLLSEEDMEILWDFERKNEAEKYLIFDANIEGHWKRCIDNKEKLSRNQFNAASALYKRLAHDHNFVLKQLSDFSIEIPKSTENLPSEKEIIDKPVLNIKPAHETKTTEQLKLDRANAINQILSKPILKAKGPIYDELEKDVRDFLNLKLADIFGNNKKNDLLSSDEVKILKEFCKKLIEKTK